METAGEAQMLGAALNHSALNLANALGAWFGGLVISAGYGYRAPSLDGAGLAVAGLVPLAVSGVLRVRDRRQSPSTGRTPMAAPEQVGAPVG
jgi:DHA1 family inner membrane transport protein